MANNNQSTEQLIADRNWKKLLCKIGIPVVLSNLLQTVYLLIDQLYIINYDPQNLYAGGIVQVIFPFIFLVQAVQSILYYGVSSKGANLIGEGNEKKVFSLVSFALKTGVFFFITLITLGILFRDSILIFSGAKGTLLEITRDYFTILLFSQSITICGAIFDGYFQAKGLTKNILYTQIGANVLNVILTPIFLFGLFGAPQMGFAGAALGTMISQIVRAAFIGILYFKRYKKVMGDEKQEKGVKGADIYWTGLPFAMSHVVVSISSFVINNVLSEIDPAYISVFGIVGRITNFAVLPAIAFSSASITIIGQAYGASDLSGVKKAYGYLTRVGFLFMTSIGLLLFFISPFIIQVVTDLETIKRIGVNFIRIESLSYGFLCVEMLSRQGFVGIQKKHKSYIQLVMRFLGIYIPAAFVLVYLFNMEENGVWFSIALANTLAGLIGYIWFNKTVNRELRGVNVTAEATA